jgi:tetratricopeptide (TPR) repeat protein
MPDAPAYAESLHAQLQYGWAPLHALRSDRFKLIEAPRVELYDLADDEAETQDRSADEPARLQAMRRELRALMATRTPSAERTVDAETAERLAALGYIGGGGPGGATPSGRDPKDGIGLVTRLGRNGMTVARTEPARAIRELTALLAEDPGMMVARRTRAVAYQSAGRHDDAIRDLRALESRGGLTAEDSVLLGDSLRVTGRTEEALQVLERAIAANPKFAQPWLSVATLRLQQQKTAEAAAAYAKVLELTPDHTEGLRGRGDVALIRGDLDGAARSYARLLEVDERDVGALTKLGVVKVRTGRAGEGMALFRKALERDPSNGEALLYLAGALASTGRPAEALPYFERALAAGPRTTMALNGLALARLALGDAAGAKAAFRESLVLDPRQPDIVAALRDIGRR